MAGQVLDSKGLFTEYRKKIYNFIYHLVQDRAEAEDLTQETFIKVHHNLTRLQDKSKLSSWIYRIATNVCLDYFRQSSYRYRSKTASLEDLTENIREIPLGEKGIEPYLTLEETIDQKVMGDCVQEFIKSLPADYRVVIVLHDLEGLTNQEIAEILDCSLDTVKIRLHRARSRLKEKLSSGCQFSRDKRNVFVCEPKK